MNRDRDPTQVIGSPATPTPSTNITETYSTPLPAPTASTPAEPLTGLSKIKQTALLLKQKVAGTNNKPQKQPNKISHPWAINPSSRSASFPSPTSSPSSPYSPNHGAVPSPSSLPTSPAHSMGGSGGKAVGIKAMIAAREDPSLSCNKMAPPGTQPIPAPQKREARAGMTKLQLSQPPSSSPSLTIQSSSAATAMSVDGQDRNDGQSKEEEQEEKKKEKEREERERRRRQKKRESIQEQQQQQQQQQETTPSTTATTTPPAAKVAVLESIPTLDFTTTESTTTTTTEKRSSRRRNGGVTLIPSQFTSTPSPSSSSSSSSSAPSPLSSTSNTTPSLGSPVQPAFMKAFEDIGPIETVKTASASEERLSTLSTTTTTTPTNTTTTIGTTARSPLTSALPPLSPSLASPSLNTTTGKTQPASLSVFDRPSMSARRHTTTNSPSSPLTSSPFVPTRHPTPPVPGLPAAGMTSHNYQPKSVINPTLRQLQTPNIPTNLVQARILQQEAEKRKAEELAKIPITANLRQVKKIQAVLVSDDEDDDPKAGRSSSASSSASSSLSAGTSTRPRSKTATATSQTSVPVSVLVGGKRRGDRNHVEPVAIPKRLADQVEHILGRKLAGKGNVLDEREKEREEEEARKAAEPLPPIVLGKPRKRAVTSAHIRNLVSSWDTKVEVAKELTSEAERIRLFLEERSTAHAEMPKPKVAPTAEELLRPLPALPPPPSPSELHQLLVNGGVASSSSNLDVAGGSIGRRRGRTVATSNGTGSSRSFGHSKGASVASASPSTSVQPPLQKTKILLSTPSQSSFVSTTTTSSSEKGAKLLEQVDQKDVEASTHRPTLSTEALDTSKRTGELLVSKTAINRPRRKRNPTITQEVM
ncbi:hypothetical protein EC957_011509 [Mortierella hygrophila]|uniref:Uncharacterized protein n=1 Tax=Mortierella hygrophila TaxID=979708 RepID=A0A9P6F8P6_9FUNG|nr:hypothetical protein EC957_011509 [Mortierella hygrophila]